MPKMVTSGHGSSLSDLGSVGPMNLLRLLAVWTAISVPVSVAAGSFLAAGNRCAARRPVPVRTSR
jgi:hypothetical protein